MKKNNKKLCLGISVAMLGFSSVIEAAEKDEIRLSKNKNVAMRTATTVTQFSSLLNLESNSSLLEISKKSREDGSIHYRFQQMYDGVPVHGDHVIITTSKSGAPVFMSGSVIRGIQVDLGEGGQRRLVSETNVLTIAKSHFEKAKQLQNQTYSSNSATLYVELDNNQVATYIYKVEFFAVVNGVPTKPIYIVDANNGKIIKHYDGLNTATAGGPGGNQRMGKIEYGQNGFPLMEITKSGTTCVLENSQVRVVDMAGGESEMTSPAAAYYCGSDNYHAEYQDNGNYGYNNDALFGGTSFVNMMSEWYGEAALPFKLIQRTNFSNNYANAYWDGSKMTYGDGGSTFHHMDSFGVVGHEVAHGYTQFHSNLVYNEQSGGINESFSDMAGEALKKYILGDNDFIVGSLLKKNSGFMRNMKNPPADGHSIDHVNSYYSGIDVHLSSGVYNKAFYLLATSPGWNTQKAFQVFLVANRDYWRPNATYQSAGSGVCQAAGLLGYDGAAVKSALNAVGVAATGCNAAPSLPVEITSGEMLTISGGEKENLRYYITVPSGATALT
ncbi:MAG: M4 family metallopeptidase, partial [Pseudomonadales bacterium]|nr:M4 family metallopeptidase [Pseudomonadales bacterium]